MIPKRISHIWIQGEQNAPSRYEKNKQMWRSLHNDWEFLFWDEQNTIDLVKTHIPEYLTYIEQASNLINKVNVIKYLNMYFYGGVYTDLDSYPMKHLDELLNETDFGDINYDSKIDYLWPYTLKRNSTKKIGEYSICISTRQTYMFFPDSSKVVLFDNPFLISNEKNEFWLNLVKYCYQRTQLKDIIHEPYGTYGLTSYIFYNYWDAYKNDIMLLPHYFIFPTKNPKSFVAHHGDAGWY